MIRHVVLFTWDEGMTKAMEQQFADELNALAPTLPGVRAYHAGRDAGINQGNFDFAVVADFDDLDSYLGYRENAEHKNIISRFSGPHTKTRAAVQSEI
jgi:Stress responsive A/B Barrel Domain